MTSAYAEAVEMLLVDDDCALGEVQIEEMCVKSRTCSTSDNYIVLPRIGTGVHPQLTIARHLSFQYNWVLRA